MEEALTTEQLWGTMRQRLLPFIRQRVGNSEDAEDIVQDVFLRIQRKLPDLKDSEAITAWIFRIARNAVTDYYRARARAGNAYETLAGHGDSPAGSLSQDDAHEQARQRRVQEPGREQACRFAGIYDKEISD